MKFWEAMREMEENGKICSWGGGATVYRFKDGKFQECDLSELKNPDGWINCCDLHGLVGVGWYIVEPWKTVKCWEMIKWLDENRGEAARFRFPGQTGWGTVAFPKQDTGYAIHTFSSTMEFQIPNE